MIQTSTKTSTSADVSLVNPLKFFIPSREGMSEKRSHQVLISSVILLVFLALGVFTVFTEPLYALITGNGNPIPTAGGVVGILFILIAYASLRVGYYLPSAYLLILTPYLAVVSADMLSPGPLTEVAYYFLALAVVLASLLTSSIVTIIVGVVAALTILVMPNLQTPAPGLEFLLYWTAIMFTLLCTGILAAGTTLRDRYVHLLEETREDLQESIIEAEAAQQRAEQSDRVKSAFLASVSHELRTPLNSIINYTKFVNRGVMGPVTDQQVETLDKVIGSGKHLLQLINDVLDISKIESGSLKLFIEENVNVNAILEEVISIGESLAHDKPVELRVEAEDLPLICADSQRITQVMLNMISNACKFTDAGEIIVRATRKNDLIELSVSDTGSGIEAENVQSVFEPFQQTNSGMRTGSGTGLGMPISKSLVEAHGGKMWFESTVDVGTTFYIQIPIQAENTHIKA